MGLARGSRAPRGEGASRHCFGQIGFATAASGGYTVTGSPFCHCTTSSPAPARRPLSSNLSRPPGKYFAGPLVVSMVRIAAATFRRSGAPAFSSASLKIHMSP